MPGLDTLQVTLEEDGDTDTKALFFGMLYGAVHLRELTLSATSCRQPYILVLLEKFTPASQ